MSVFFSSSNQNTLPFDPSGTSAWIKRVIEEEGYKLGKLEYHFTDDEILNRINKKYLNHDTLTDVISFDYTQNKMVIGEIYISLERVAENAIEHKVDHILELSRVMVHGVLHLLGYKDFTQDEKKVMAEKEDYYLSLHG